VHLVLQLLISLICPSDLVKGAYPITVFNQNVIVSTNRDQEEYYLHVVEHVNPLLPFGSLTTDIKHPIGEISELENSLSNARSTQTSSQNVLVGW